MQRIIGGIYVGSIDVINDKVDLKEKYNITHILSILRGGVEVHNSGQYEHKIIEINDEETVNILEHFEDTNKFIDEALHGTSEVTNRRQTHKGCILIHCAQGTSRSVAFAVAYLMYSYNLKYEQAMHAVKRKIPNAEPNRGFQEQLTLYEKLEHHVSQDDPIYRDFVFQLSYRRDHTGHEIRDLSLITFKSVDTSSKNTPFDSLLRCKKCRQVVAMLSQVEAHEQPEIGSKESRFIKKAPNSRRIISANSGSTICSHYFLSNPLEWMRPELQEKGEIEGKFNCYKCGTKIGGYSWRGSRCSCGKWMIPALHLQTSKVDCMPT